MHHSPLLLFPFLKEQRKECWIGRGAKSINKLSGVCGGGEEVKKDSKCALFDPSARV